MRKVLIYTLKDPQTNEVRYVGKTVQSLSIRLIKHLCLAKNDNTYRARWIRQLKQLNLRPIIELIEIVEMDKWRTAECEYISKFKEAGAKLINTAPGGIGSDWLGGETIEKIRKANTGKIMSESTKEKIRQQKVGKKMNREHVEKIRKANTGKKRDRDFVEKQTLHRRKKFQEKITALRPSILELYIQGLSQVKISKMLHLGKDHVRKILNESNLRILNRAEAIKHYFEHHYLKQTIEHQ